MSTDIVTRTLAAAADSLTCQNQDPPEVTVPEDTTIHMDVPYVTGADAAQTLDLYVPSSSEPVPLIVYIHGGAFFCGDKNQETGITRQVSNGYAVALINYRVVPNVAYPTPIVDCKSAIRFLRANATTYNINPKYVIACGFSCGAYFANMVGATNSETAFDVGENLDQSSAVQAVMVLSGMVDFVEMHHYRQVTGTVGDEHDISEVLYLGGIPGENIYAASQASPLTHLTTSAPPYLVCHGDADYCIPYQQSAKLVQTLVKLGISTTFHAVKGVSHEDYADYDDVFRVSTAFLQAHNVF